MNFTRNQVRGRSLVNLSLMLMFGPYSVWAESESTEICTADPQTLTAEAADGALTSVYVDGQSTCQSRTGLVVCSAHNGPYLRVGEGERGLLPGGRLTINGGFYNEAVLLNRSMLVTTADSHPVTIRPFGVAQFDLIGDAVDDNLLLFNPKWGDQRRVPPSLPDYNVCPEGRGMRHDPGSSACSNQFTYLNGPGSFCDDGPHVNWFGVTYKGVVFWEDWSADDDYNIKLITEDGAGYTASNSDHILSEFDSEETIDKFHTAWWTSFHEAVRAGRDQARAKIDGRDAIMSGMMGLDCEHNCGSEIHPVWALMMNVDPGVDDDRWAFFVRSWGNEGFCSTEQELAYFPNNSYTFRLRWRTGANDVDLRPESVAEPYHIQTPSWFVTKIPARPCWLQSPWMARGEMAPCGMATCT